jgi:hypothetical protein
LVYDLDGGRYSLVAAPCSYQKRRRVGVNDTTVILAPNKVIGRPAVCPKHAFGLTVDPHTRFGNRTLREGETGGVCFRNRLGTRQELENQERSPKSENIGRLNLTFPGNVAGGLRFVDGLKPQYHFRYWNWQRSCKEWRSGWFEGGRCFDRDPRLVSNA